MNRRRWCLTVVIVGSLVLLSCDGRNRPPGDSETAPDGDTSNTPDVSDTVDGTDPGPPTYDVQCNSVADPEPLPPGDYYVAKSGDDSNDGTSRSNPFGTIQKGVDALSTGDTLVVGPGEYRGSVSRSDLGGPDAKTTIRAAIPGTVILRGDVPAPEFEKLEGYRFIYVADSPKAGSVQTVNELDSLNVLEEKPNLEGLEYSPGTFYQDEQAGKIYLSTTDMRPVSTHRYSLSLESDEPAGLMLRDPERVVVDGIAATGFNTNHEIDHSEHTMSSVWGIFLEDPQDCTVRNSYAWLNGRGIGIWSNGDEAGGSVIEDSTAWANISQYGIGDTGGITLIRPDRDTIRDSTSFLNGDYGINIRGQKQSGTKMSRKSSMETSLAWGNGAHDIRLKTGESHFHETIRVAALGTSADSELHPEHCLLGETESSHDSDTIVLEDEDDLDLDAEFADPDNRDYRLQANSKFRGAADDGSDRGPYPYEGNVHYVSPDGDDSNDGLSIENAWSTLSRAAEDLEPGDTLYLAPGSYSGDLDLNVQATSDEPISIRGRGTAPVVLKGAVSVRGSAHVDFRRLVFEKTVEVSDSEHVSFENSRFLSNRTGLLAANNLDVSVTDSTFTGFEKAAVALPCSKGSFLAGNLYDNADGTAVWTDDLASIRHSDHNSYRTPSRSWVVDDEFRSLTDLRNEYDRYSKKRVPTFQMRDDIPTLTNRAKFAGGGRFGRPFGTYRYEPRGDDLRLTAGPEVHSVTDTTANIEWFTSLPAEVTLAWGETQNVKNEETFQAQNFGTYSLTGLQPGTTYYFELKSLEVPEELSLSADPVELNGKRISFETDTSSPSGETFYVAPDGDNDHSGTSEAKPWRTIQYAASRAGPGDTVVVGGGTYRESVRVRATGAPGAPITFRAAAGEKAVLDGAELALNQGFVVAGKSHLRFDGFFFRMFNFSPGGSGTYHPMDAADFNVYDSHDIHLTRFFSDGRGATTSRSVVAYQTSELLIRNAVNVNKFQAMFFKSCPDLRVEHSAFTRPMITNFLLRNPPDAPSRFESNIFTDNLEKKADNNIWIFTVDQSTDGMLQTNNVYFLRDSPPQSQRNVFYSNTTLADAEQAGFVVDPVTADPEFAGIERLRNMGQSTWEYPPDQLTQPDLTLDFSDFFATNPAVTADDIGLQKSKFGSSGLPN